MESLGLRIWRKSRCLRRVNDFPPLAVLPVVDVATIVGEATLAALLDVTLPVPFVGEVVGDLPPPVVTLEFLSGGSYVKGNNAELTQHQDLTQSS